MKLSAPIHVLKRKAKLLAREAETPLNQALDRVAKEEGFSSWGLLAARHPAKAAQPKTSSGASQITALPLGPADKAEFIETANAVFEMVIDRIEPDNPEATRKLWDAEHYVDHLLLTEDMLPIDRDYALSLIDAFLVHHVIGLATQADDQAEG